ncbi:MAG: purple acid phosphatase family protein [Candidatus Heimdallarchaeaceae archaeon]
MRLRRKLLIIFIILITLSPIYLQFRTFASNYSVSEVHFSWMNDSATTIVVSWKTPDPTDSVVQYGLTREYDYVALGEEAKFHYVEITGLLPNTIYHLRVGNGEFWSKDYTVKTAREGDHVRFLAMGDSRSFRDVRTVVANLASRFNADLTVFTGDFIDDGREKTLWNYWFRDFEPLLSKMPFMSVLGNHEKNSSLYYERFAYPGKEEYYSFNFGSIHFIALHSCVTNKLASERFTS